MICIPPNMWSGGTGPTRGSQMAAAAAAVGRAASMFRASARDALQQARHGDGSSRDSLPDLNQVSKAYRGGGTYLPAHIRAAARGQSAGPQAKPADQRQPRGMCTGACALYCDGQGLGWIEVRVVAVHNDPQGGYITISLPPPHGGERETEPSKLILKSAHRDPHQIPKGCLCLYFDKNSSRWVQVTVTAVHTDPVEDFFSIQLPCGAHRETELAKLYPIPGENARACSNGEGPSLREQISLPCAKRPACGGEGPPTSDGSSAQVPIAPALGTRAAHAASRPVVVIDLCDEPPAKRSRPDCAEHQSGQSSAPLPEAHVMDELLAKRPRPDYAEHQSGHSKQSSRPPCAERESADIGRGRSCEGAQHCTTTDAPESMELAPEYSVPLLPKAQLSLVTGLADLLRTIEDAVGAAALDWCLKNDVDHVDQIVAVGAKEEERFVREVGVQPDGVKARLLRRRLEERRRLLRAGV